MIADHRFFLFSSKINYILEGHCLCIRHTLYFFTFEYSSSYAIVSEMGIAFPIVLCI